MSENTKAEGVRTLSDLTWKPDDNGVTILGYDEDGVWHDVIDAHDCGPEWLARRLNMAKALAGALVLESEEAEIKGEAYTVIVLREGWPPDPSMPGRWRLVPVGEG